MPKGDAIAHKTRKGFNLIESAIILGVVGLVIGGIWAAAASVRSKNEANSHAQLMIKSYYGTLQLFGNNRPTVQTNIKPTLISTGILPPDGKTTNGYTLVSEWKAGHFTIVTIATPPAFCTQVVNTLITALSKEPDTTKLWVNQSVAPFAAVRGSTHPRNLPFPADSCIYAQNDIWIDWQ